MVENIYSVSEHKTHVKNVLVVGAGGIGCELSKLLCLSSELKITIIDFDTIELTNLNRQFFFTEQDIGKYKSEVVGQKIKDLTNWDVTTITESIFKYDLDFFKKFDVVYNCLDNNETRSYVNLRCFLGNIKLIDGGSSGFKGQSCIFDYSNECFDCLPKPNQKTYNLCTIRSIPTKFEHCIEFVKSVFFDDEFDFKEIIKKFRAPRKFYKKFVVSNLLVNKDQVSLDLFYNKIRRDIKKLIKYISFLLKKYNKISDYDKDEIYKVKLLYRLSCMRSKSAGIDVLSYFDFQNIANNIIPSLCTTNSIVASFMLLSEKSNKYYFLTLGNKLYNELYPSDKNSDCSVCSKKWVYLVHRENSTALDLFKFMNKKFKIDCKYLMTENNILYSKFPNNLSGLLSVTSNSVCTLGYDEDGIMKIYISGLGDEFLCTEK
ncbi:SUMO-activating enzyme subunit 2 [Vairimorpha necatrix]|uniref:NEDD8-activating enzyme E1 catalytic subunit n=1 Tax=Vairimorpha necatrix TaxID=6039 RepID=A0AAX4JGI6_9MICR